MNSKSIVTIGISLIAVLVAVALTTPVYVAGQAPAQGQGQAQGPGQGRGQGGRGQGPGQAANLPQNPTAVPLPTVSDQITSPGPIYESVQSLAAGKGLANFKYEAKEYFITGTANGQPYKTRIVVRKPSNNSRFSRLVLVE